MGHSQCETLRGEQKERSPSSKPAALLDVVLDANLHLWPAKFEHVFTSEHIWSGDLREDASICALFLMHSLFSLGQTTVGKQSIHRAVFIALTCQMALLFCKPESYRQWRVPLQGCMRLLKHLFLVAVVLSFSDYYTDSAGFESVWSLVCQLFLVTGVAVNAMNMYAYRLSFRYQVFTEGLLCLAMVVATSGHIAASITARDQLNLVVFVREFLSRNLCLLWRHLLLLELEDVDVLDKFSCAQSLVVVVQVCFGYLLPMYALYWSERTAKLNFIRQQDGIAEDTYLLPAYAAFCIRAIDSVLQVFAMVSTAFVVWFVVDTVFLLATSASVLAAGSN